MTYNGHKDWEHWNVSLWINNDETLYRHAQNAMQHFGLADEAARYLIRNHLPDKTPDGAPYTFSAVRAAIKDL